MNFDDILSLLDKTPVIVDIHPVSLCYLPNDVTIFESTSEAAWHLDDPKTTLPARILITHTTYGYSERFPYKIIEHNPFTTDLNKILFERFDLIALRMLRQSQLADIIVKESHDYDIIVLLLVDGLSFRDITSWGSLHNLKSIEPCLVDVPTLTHVAFPNIIGTPPLAAKLFDLGYHQRLGYSYWYREDNTLTDELFYTIPKVRKVGDFRKLIIRESALQMENIFYFLIPIQMLKRGQ